MALAFLGEGALDIALAGTADAGAGVSADAAWGTAAEQSWVTGDSMFTGADDTFADPFFKQPAPGQTYGLGAPARFPVNQADPLFYTDSVSAPGSNTGSGSLSVIPAMSDTSWASSGTQGLLSAPSSSMLSKLGTGLSGIQKLGGAAAGLMALHQGYKYLTRKPAAHAQAHPNLLQRVPQAGHITNNYYSNDYSRVSYANPRALTYPPVTSRGNYAKPRTMPRGYGKRRFGFRRRRRSHRYGRKRTFGGSARFRSANRRTGGYIGMERKFLDDEMDASTIAITWGEHNPATRKCLSSVAEGTGESERIGRHHAIDSLYIRGNINTAVGEAQTSPQTDALVRVIIGIDKQTNGAEVVPGSVVDLGQTNDFEAMRNLQTSAQFRILLDTVIKVPGKNVNEGSANAFTWTGVTVPFKYFHKFRTPLKIHSNGTGGTISNVRNNSIFIMAVLDGSPGPTVYLSYQSRIRFRG